MTDYIDGFAFPVSREHLAEYRRTAEAIAVIWKEYGALAYREFLGDDMVLEGTRSFLDAIEPGEDEVVVFGWVAFDSREARDAINKKVASDPRVAELMTASDTGFNPERMAYGGFRSMIDV